ncbi:4-hydroxythreonine-4-phosphate dehydrogenase PdxA [Geopsychrobacter electrodiphilus]|uniref:4-hydroxythreonine-4-phosphate dehydrogenase PdxA n=1 Tax=Geopsychrobacter electrodiphilus TaxID=225196 RepID=UPI0003712E61|nr:4-hydroxythreonine-4-phosphate dehydrogenase PdxA [Geopsychrobacter electrodiphilus]
MRPIIITMGDPTGIGPELILRSLAAGGLPNRPLLVVGDLQVLQNTATQLGVKPQISTDAQGRTCFTLKGNRFSLQPLSQLAPDNFSPGHPDDCCGRAMVAYIEWAISECRAGRAAAMVTCPINKAAINRAGCHFPGHTELLGERCQAKRVVMMLAGSHLRVTLATIHTALAKVPGLLDSQEIFETIRITDKSLREHFGLKVPRIAVLALNPHAGEEGLFGDEEERFIRPAIALAQQAGICASGPHSADTLFYFAARGDYDAVVCMYHDQGLIPLKLLHFDDAVNVTLGLPIVRTSVDHGTAYDLVGSGRASIASLQAAIQMAARMADNLKF